MYLHLFFVYSGAVSAPLVFYSDPNRDPNADLIGNLVYTLLRLFQPKANIVRKTVRVK